MTHGAFSILAATASDEVVDDLKARSRRFADRKAARFLDGAAMSPFVATMEVFAGNEGIDPARTAIFTVSEWEPAVPPPPFELDDSPATRERLARHYQDEGNPTDWLRGMPNNALCQAAIVASLRGPNTHYIGRAPSLEVVFAMATTAIDDEFADVALVVAFDTEDDNPPPDLAETRSAAVLIGPPPDTGTELTVAADWSPATTARAALDEIIAASRAESTPHRVVVRLAPVALTA